MTVILIPLAVLALADGLLNLPFGMGKRWLGHFLASVPGAVVDMDATSGLFLGMAILSASLSLAGILLAWFLYRRPKTVKEPGSHPLLFSAFYLDAAYRILVVRPYQWASTFFWQKIDKKQLDQNFESLGISFNAASVVMRLWTTGRISTYLKAFLVGLAGFLALFVGRVTLW